MRGVTLPLEKLVDKKWVCLILMEGFGSREGRVNKTK